MRSARQAQVDRALGHLSARLLVGLVAVLVGETQRHPTACSCACEPPPFAPSARAQWRSDNEKRTARGDDPRQDALVPALHDDNHQTALLARCTRVRRHKHPPANGTPMCEPARSRTKRTRATPPCPRSSGAPLALRPGLATEPGARHHWVLAPWRAPGPAWPPRQARYRAPQARRAEHLASSCAAWAKTLGCRSRRFAGVGKRALPHALPLGGKKFDKTFLARFFSSISIRSFHDGARADCGQCT